LSVILIHVPSLNERIDDIPLLSEKFVKDICKGYGVPEKVIQPKAVKELQSFNWSGNIRELHNVLERLVILSNSKITHEDVVNYVSPSNSFATSTDVFEKYEKFQDFKDYMEQEFIAFRLKKNNWNISKTAEQLDIQRSHLYNKIEKFG